MNDNPPHSRNGRLVLATAMVAMMLAPVAGHAAEATSAATSAAACAGRLFAHSRPYLTGLVGTSAATDFYAGAEHQNPTAILTVTPAETCTEDPNDFADSGRALYATANGSASAPGDYQAIGQTLSDAMCVLAGDPPHDPCPAGTTPTDQVTLDLADDSMTEAAVESFRFVLARDPSGPPLSSRHPTQAAVHVIDNDGSARVSLEPTLDGGETMEYVAPEQSGNYDIPVFWAGSTGPTGSVPFTIGSAPGFPQPTPGVDYNLLTQSPLPETAFTFGGGRVAFIKLRIINDNQVEPDEAFSVTLTGANAEADRDTTTVVIPDAGVDSIAPETRFHHPRQGLKYRKADYRIREFHTYYKDQGGSGMRRAQLALRRKMENGGCAWWRGGRFKPGPCNQRVWLAMKHDEANFLFFYRFKPLKPTVGTRIKSYRAWTRGRDWAGNLETRFKQGRNVSTFWVRKK